MSDLVEKWKDYWFFSVQGISSAKKKQLVENGYDSNALFNIEETQKNRRILELLSEKELAKLCESRTEKNWEKEYEKVAQAGARVVSWLDPEYPSRLKQLKGMPYALGVKGELPDEDAFVVAIVGARNCTPYGERMTIEFAEKLAEAGIQVVSGMARGIDGAAHRGSLDQGGKSFAVLGCGVDICYPPEHLGLYRDLEKCGGILSEYPCGTAPLSRHFPARNRIISGLADVVLVMEARAKSGSLITADMAMDQGKDVYALPGPVTSKLSEGCNFLIRQGAGILLNPDDLLNELCIQNKNKCKISMKIDDIEKKVLERKENLVYSKLGLYPVSREELIRMTGLSPQEISAVLVNLQLNGYIKEQSKNFFIRKN